MKLSPSTLVLAVAVVPFSGCKEYFSVDEACPESLQAGTKLSPLDEQALLRLNCHRRLVGVSKAVGNELVEKASHAALDYLLLNPATDGLSGEEREHFWLKQRVGAPGYTGYTAAERLTDPVTGAGYTFYDQVGSGVWEYIDIQWNADGTPMPSGKDAVDYLMKDPEFRQAALQPSLLDAGWAEIDLPQTWFLTAGWEDRYPDEPPPSAAKAYYFMSIYTAPHVEHATTPVIYPKEDQKDVPLWSFTHTPLEDGSSHFSQMGFPVTFLVGAIDPANYAPIDQNQYQATITSAAILGPDGLPVDTVIHEPGDDIVGTLPDGTWMRNTVTVYPLEPLLPSTKYTVAAEVTSPENSWSYQYDFTTTSAEKDPGYDANAQATTDTTTTTGTPTGLTP